MRWILHPEAGHVCEELAGCIATLGVFDGLHLGHRAILDRTLTWARTEERPAVVVTFSTHPDEIVRGKAPALLMSLEHRRRELERCGLDAGVLLEFNQKMREIPAETFVRQFLVNMLALRGLVLGHDTAVGRDRRGDAAFLRSLGRELGFGVEVVGEISLDGTVVSSTRIRQALRAGDLAEAARLLGRRPSLLGEVIHGDGRGKSLGFPTANLSVASECLPADGVYAVLAPLGGRVLEGLCNIGRRPTFHPAGPTAVEVFLLNFEGDLYGKTLELVFLARLRGERTFAGGDELRAQIARDREAAEEVFREVRPQG